jgi:hypothetical protein
VEECRSVRPGVQRFGMPSMRFASSSSGVKWFLRKKRPDEHLTRAASAV